MASSYGRNLVTRAIQKRDKTRVALRKTACGIVLIDGLPFSVGVESDGAASSQGVMFTITGKSVDDGGFKIHMMDVTFPTSAGTKSIKRKPELYKKKDGKYVLRCLFSEIKIPDCNAAQKNERLTREQLMMQASTNQVVFRFTPEYRSKDNDELMINIYPVGNPIDGSVTEWVTATSDHDFFENGGLTELLQRGKGK